MTNFWATFRRTLSFRRETAQADEGTKSGAAAPYRPGDYTRIFNYYGNQSAMNVAAVYRCVKIISESVANLPLRYRRLKNGIFTDYEDSRLFYLLTIQPDIAKSAFDFTREMVEQVLLYGNAYIVPIFSAVTMDVDRLVLCSPGTVSHDAYNDRYTITDYLNGVSGVYDEDEIIHVKGHSTNGKEGISVLQYARQTLDIATAGDRETYNRFANGGNIRGIIAGDKVGTTGFGEYQDKELQKTAEDVDTRFGRGEHIVSLPGQVDFKQITLSSTDMQFLESRKFTVREICRFFGVHPSFVFDDTSNNYKSAEMANVAFLSSTLNPLLRNVENEFQRKLIPEKLCTKRRFEFDRRAIYACDLDSKVKYQNATIAAGIYSVNDWRREENRPTVEGGDKVLVSANLKEITSDMTGGGIATTTDNNENQKKENEE